MNYHFDFFSLKRISLSFLLVHEHKQAPEATPAYSAIAYMTYALQPAMVTVTSGNNSREGDYGPLPLPCTRVVRLQ